MLDTILGSKVGMSQTFVEGTRVPVTFVKVGPCVVTQVRKHDNYWSIQLGYGEKKIKNVTKPLQGHLRGVIKDNKAPLFLREVRVYEEPTYKVGDIVKFSDVLKVGDLIEVTGVTKGKGFAGVVKRWGFHGGPRTHGQSDRERAPGAISMGTSPGRIHKGKRMAGRMGVDSITIKNLIIVSVDPEKDLVGIANPVPGTKGTLLRIKKLASGKLQELVEEVKEVEAVEGVEEGGGEAEKTPEAPAETKTE